MKWLALISILAIALLMFTKGVNVYNMLETGDDGSSYADISAFIYVVAGLGLVYVAWKTVKFNFANPLALVPYAIGISCFLYGVFLLSIKGVIAL